MAEHSVRERVQWSQLRYASVWEDADVLCAALAPVASGGRLLSIASAGDNALALLTLGPREIVAVDFNPAQLAALALRMAAFEQLESEELLAFLGVLPSGSRGSTYARLRSRLPLDARSFWDQNTDVVEAGIIHAGKFERYLRAFRRWVLPLVHSRRTMEALREERSAEEQSNWYDKRWETWRYRFLFRLFFSRTVMGRLGRDPALFTHVKGSVGERILERTRYALRELPSHSNPYLAYIMTGNYQREALPRYLRPENHAAIREGLSRLTLIRGGVEAAEGEFDGFNLSDIFEYMDDTEHCRIYAHLLEHSRPGSRLVYWNMLAPRSCPDMFRSQVEPLRSLSQQLHLEDRAWFYSDFHVDEVRVHHP